MIYNRGCLLEEEGDWGRMRKWRIVWNAVGV